MSEQRDLRRLSQRPPEQQHSASARPRARPGWQPAGCLDAPSGCQSRPGPLLALRRLPPAAGGAWNAPASACDLGNNCYADATPPDLAIDRTGNAIALWVERRDDTDGDGNDDWNVFSAYRPAGGTWGPHRRASTRPVSNDGDSLSVALDDAGNAFALWAPRYEISYPTGSFFFATARAGGQWQAPVALSDGLPAGRAWDPALTVDAAGNAFAVWTLKRDGANTLPEVRFAYRPAQGAWSASSRLAVEADDMQQHSPAVTSDAAGNAYALWLTRQGPYNCIVHFSMKPPGQPWSQPETVHQKLDRWIDCYTPPAIAVDPSGRVYAAYRTGRWRLRATLPAGLPVGVYDVTVVNPGGRSGVLTGGFTVTQAATATPTRTPTITRTTSPTVTRTPTASATPTRTPTASATPTRTPTASATPTPTGGAPVVRNGDFENGSDGSWSESSSGGYPLIYRDSDVSPTWQWHDGHFGAWLGGAHDELAILSQSLSVPAAAQLSYWIRISSEDSCGFDQAWVAINNDQLTSYDLCAANALADWTRQALDLSAYAGQTVLLSFLVSTDNSLYSSFWLDTVAVNAADGSAGTPLPPAQPADGDAPLAKDQP